MKLSLRIGLIFLAIIFFLILNLFSVSKEIRNFFYLISSPIQRFFWKTGMEISDFFWGVLQNKSLKRENQELKLNIQELISQNASLEELKRENEILRQSLNLGLEKEFNLALAQLIGKDVSQDYLIINLGQKNGIAIGQPVITPQRVLVGKISEVYDNFSKIKLLTFKDNSFDVEIINQSEKGVYGLAKGEGNFKLSIELIPKGEDITIGNKVFTTVLGGNFPKGLLVGGVINVKKTDIRPFQTADIKPAFEVEDLDFLFVITNFKND